MLAQGYMVMVLDDTNAHSSFRPVALSILLWRGSRRVSPMCISTQSCDLLGSVHIGSPF